MASEPVFDEVKVHQGMGEPREKGIVHHNEIAHLNSGAVYNLAVGEWIIVQSFAGRTMAFCDCNGNIHTVPIK